MGAHAQRSRRTHGVSIADIDHDGQFDVVSTRDGRFVGVSAVAGDFAQRDLGLVMPNNFLDFATDPGQGAAPAQRYIAQKVCDP